MLCKRLFEQGLKSINRDLAARKIGKGILIWGNSICRTGPWEGLEYPGISGTFSTEQAEDVRMDRWETSLQGKGPRGTGVLGNQLSKRKEKKK